LTLLVGQQEGHLACKKTEWYGLCPLPRNCFGFRAQNGEIWCLLGAIVYSAAACFTSKLTDLMNIDKDGGLRYDQAPSVSNCKFPTHTHTAD